MTAQEPRSAYEIDCEIRQTQRDLARIDAQERAWAAASPEIRALAESIRNTRKENNA